ncbi:MAG: MotA/TolQ/ExbB proton channel family protein [Hyphomicrobium sp.]
MDPTLAETAAHNLTIVGLFHNADIVVKSIMIGLAIASIVCWALIFEKLFRMWRLNREIRRLETAADSGALPADGAAGLNDSISSAARSEWKDGARGAPNGELRDRLEQAMRGAMRRELKTIEKGLPFLATLGSAAPFIGLFGTVWGIMNSFTAIAQSQDTSLAVVAPGIAEALFATAVGLAAAIPAVIAYNQFTVSLGRAADKIAPAISNIARSLSRRSVEGVI